jgi:hypothetical protein
MPPTTTISTVRQFHARDGGLRRFLIFGLLGPPLGMLTGMWGIVPVLNGLLGGPSVFDYHQLVLIPLAYQIGLLPALLVAVFDGLLARRGVRYRVGWSALFGFAMSFIPLLGALSMGFLHGPFVAIFGLLGAAPAAACSWLAGEGAPRVRCQETVS